nr:MAG TPA_asm: hypothetical protein [Bacteriophage sp.]
MSIDVIYKIYVPIDIIFCAFFYGHIYLHMIYF